MKYTVVALASLAAFSFAGCGYHVSGHADLVPQNIKTIAIPAVGNLTTHYKLSDKLAAKLTREFISRTRYRVVSEPDQADAVLKAAVISYFAYPVVSEQASGRATTAQMNVTLQVSLTERGTGKVLFNRPNMDMRQRYEISTNQLAYFEESDAALDRMSGEVARSVVSAILEMF